MVVGLGNPGKKYERTRHNVGFLVLDELAARGSVKFKRDWKSTSRVGTLSQPGEELLLVKPQTHMNRSGYAVASLMRRKNLDDTDVIIVFDDADLACGQLRIRGKGSAGGHNGMGSVLDLTGTNEIVRIRVGIGPRPSGEELVEYVLSSFSREEEKLVREAVEATADAVISIVHDGIDRAMTQFNKK